MSKRETIELSGLVESTIAELFPSEDPLDQPNFDPTAYLNERFPNEDALNANLDPFLAKLKLQIRALDDELRSGVRAAAVQKDQAALGVSMAISSISELCDKVKSVKSKAEESERMVKEICADVKQLDCAKKNLTSTFTALKRLHMFSSAVDQLESMANHKQYFEAGNLLIAVNDLMEYFKEFKSIRKLGDLSKRTVICRKVLEDSIMADFKLLGSAPDKIEGEALFNLQAACFVMQTLGEEHAQKLINFISQVQLLAYNMIFENFKDAGALDQAERRFAWLRRQLRTFITGFGEVFPKEWNLPGRICLEWAAITHQHFLKIMTESSEKNTLDVRVLVKILQRTINFEEELDRYYSTVGAVQLYYDEDPDRFEEFADGMTGDTVKRKYKDIKLESELKGKELRRHSDVFSKVKMTAVGNTQRLIFKGVISKSFSGFMTQFVSTERTLMLNTLEKINKEEDWLVLSPRDDKLLGQSNVLFRHINNSLKRCARLDTRNVFYECYLEYKRGLRGYHDVLKDHIPKKPEGAPLLRKDEMLLICLIVNTCEYCAETIPKLQHEFLDVIDDKYKEKIDLEDEKELFQGLINRVLDAAVQSVVASLDQALVAIDKTSWATWESVGDSSPYVSELKSIFNEQLPLIAQNVTIPEYHFYFCNTLGQSFITKYLAAISRIKKINDLGAQQLLLDAQDIEHLLKGLPKIGKSEEESFAQTIPKSFGKLVKKEMGKVVVVLKTIAAPVASTGETFRTLVRNGHASDLIRILDIKGIKKADQQAIVDAYNKKVPPSSQTAAFFGSEDTSKKFIFF